MDALPSVELPEAIRSLDRLYLLVIWVETLLYGINVVVFGSVVYVVFVQDLVVIWRLYLVWSSWKVIAIPLIVEGFHAGNGRLAKFVESRTHHYHCSAAMFYAVVQLYLGAAIEDRVIQQWSLVSWALDLAVNALGTLAIAGRLWWIGRRTAPMKPGGRNAYLGVAFIVLESGAMFTVATLVLVILYVNTPTAQVAAASVYVVTQMAMLSPLLIIVRVWLNINHGSSRTTTTVAKSGNSSAGHGFNQTAVKRGSSPAPVRVLVSQSERVDFPGEAGKGQYEMNILDSYEQTKGSSFSADSV
ncbi:hypothetical protein NLI96_g10647 [Meripilus lineatus]|uniref:Transmembrane protein n=1 Tax=Meripilus lineatus TaxID=2056292 RepID=A0AAD5UVL9_9APHY|nr:hypothetical protein NLI96_g10647 [Physisporinus lineatus]